MSPPSDSAVVDIDSDEELVIGKRPFNALIADRRAKEFHYVPGRRQAECQVTPTPKIKKELKKKDGGVAEHSESDESKFLSPKPYLDAAALSGETSMNIARRPFIRRRPRRPEVKLKIQESPLFQPTSKPPKTSAASNSNSTKQATTEITKVPNRKSNIASETDNSSERAPKSPSLPSLKQVMESWKSQSKATLNNSGPAKEDTSTTAYRNHEATLPAKSASWSGSQQTFSNLSSFATPSAGQRALRGVASTQSRFENMKPTISPQITKTSPIMLMLMRAYDKLEEMINSKTDSQILMRQEAIIEKLNARVEQEGTGFDALLNPRLEIGEEQQKVELKSGTVPRDKTSLKRRRNEEQTQSFNKANKKANMAGLECRDMPIPVSTEEGGSSDERDDLLEMGEIPRKPLTPFFITSSLSSPPEISPSYNPSAREARPYGLSKRELQHMRKQAYIEDEFETFADETGGYSPT